MPPSKPSQTSTRATPPEPSQELEDINLQNRLPPLPPSLGTSSPRHQASAPISTPSAAENVAPSALRNAISTPSIDFTSAPTPNSLSRHLSLRVPRSPSTSSHLASFLALPNGNRSPPKTTNTSTSPYCGQHTVETAFENLRAVFDMFASSSGKEVKLSLEQFHRIVRLVAYDEGKLSSEDVLAKLRIACNLDKDAPVPESIPFATFVTFFAIFDADQHLPPFQPSPQNLFDVLRPVVGHDRNKITPVALVNALNTYGLVISIDEAKAMTDFAATQPNAEHFNIQQLEHIVSRMAELTGAGDKSDYQSQARVERGVE